MQKQEVKVAGMLLLLLITPFSIHFIEIYQVLLIDLGAPANARRSHTLFCGLANLDGL